MEYARRTEKLADPTDLPFDEALLDANGIPDPEKVTAAVDALIARKPHLADRRPTGSIDQGARSTEAEFSFGDALRAAVR